MINDQLAKWVASLKNDARSPAEDLPASRKAVFMMLLAYASWKGRRCYPGIPRLARDTSLSERTVQDSLRDLERLGLTKKVRTGCRGDGHGRGRLANEYRVSVPEELLPSRYRTNRQPLPESQQGLTGNQDRLTGNERRDQPATIATQDNHRKITNKQDNGRFAPEAAGAVFSAEEAEIRAEAIRLGVKPGLVDATLLFDGTQKAEEVLVNLKRWGKLNWGNASKAWQSISQKGDTSGSKLPSLPFDGTELANFARAHGLPEARLGEDALPYRQRLLDHLRNDR